MNFAKPINDGKSLESRLDGQEGGGTAGEVQEVNMTTRRALVKAGAGLAAIIAASKAPASLVRSMLGMHNAMMADCKPTAKDYVQDGLVAMWDGIENAGWGKHDENATTWRDLIGGRVLNVNKTYDKYTASPTGTFDNTTFKCDGLSVEIVMRSNPSLDVTQFGREIKIAVPPISFNRRNDIIVKGGVLYFDYSRIGQSLSNTVPRLYSFMFDGSNASSTMNGSNRQTFSYTYNFSEDLAIGIGSGWVVSQYYNIRIYNRVLSDAEVAHNYEIDKVRFSL